MNAITNFTDCEQALAEKSADVFAVGLSVYHGLGVVEIMPRATIVCLDDEGLVSVAQGKGLSVFSWEKETNRQNQVFRSSAKLLAQPETVDFLKSKSDRPQLYITKPYPRLEKMAQKFGWDLLAPTAKLNHLFEDKTSFAKLIESGPLTPFPRQVITINQTQLQAAGKKFGWPLVVQFDRGLAGEGTFLLKDETVIADFAASYEGKSGVAAPKVTGRTITLNACVVSSGVVLGAPFLQISGVKELNATWSGTCGNDYGVELGITAEQRQNIFDQTLAVGELMRGRGYKGLFGLDFMVSDQVQLIEINARPPASVPTFTQLEHANDEVPLLGLHLLEFLGIPYEIDLPTVNKKKFTAEHRGSKLVFRNTDRQEKVVKSENRAGVYQVAPDGLDYKRAGISTAALQDQSEALFWSAKQGKKINANAEMATMIMSVSATDHAGKLNDQATAIVKKTIARI